MLVYQFRHFPSDVSYRETNNARSQDGGGAAELHYRVRFEQILR